MSETIMADDIVGLEKELATYKRLLPTLRDQEGRFALIAGDDLLGTFDTYSDALDEGYREKGLSPFLVKKISSVEIISYFTRDFRSCPISATA
jgi:hypothetical protein